MHTYEMKIPLLGKDGQVGRELQRSLAPLSVALAHNRNHASSPNDFSILKGLAADQIGAPTGTDLDADVIAHALRTTLNEFLKEDT